MFWSKTGKAAAYARAARQRYIRFVWEDVNVEEVGSTRRMAVRTGAMAALGCGT